MMYCKKKLRLVLGNFDLVFSTVKPEPTDYLQLAAASALAAIPFGVDANGAGSSGPLRVRSFDKSPNSRRRRTSRSDSRSKSRSPRRKRSKERRRRSSRSRSRSRHGKRSRSRSRPRHRRSNRSRSRTRSRSHGRKRERSRSKDRNNEHFRKVVDFLFHFFSSLFSCKKLTKASKGILILRLIDCDHVKYQVGTRYLLKTTFTSSS